MIRVLRINQEHGMSVVQKNMCRKPFFFEFVSRMRVIVFDQLADLDSASSFESCDLSHA